jgi:Xaa-Pro aminopeptidase
VSVIDFGNRRRLFRELAGGAPAVLPAASRAFRSRDTEYPFRQDSDFHYLTGFPDPDAVAFLDEDRFLLFVPPRDPEKEIWEGEREGVNGAARYGASGHPIDRLEPFLSDALRQAGRVYFPLAKNARLGSWLRGHVAGRKGGAAPEIADPGSILARLRVRKEPAEIERIETAARISARAHAEAASAIAPGRREYEIQAIVESAFRMAGASGPAYPSIVASGANATILHYMRNDRVIERGDLVLLDAGAEWDLYAADITRTHSVGAPSPEQAAVLAIVAEAQEAGIRGCRPGSTVGEVHRKSQEVLARGLVELGVLAGGVSEILESDRQKPFTLHRTSHWLGLDVHDAGPPGDVALEPGMVLTVEPGLYFRDRDGKLSGIGARIEDDVLITAEGPRVLSR